MKKHEPKVEKKITLQEWRMQYPSIVIRDGKIIKVPKIPIPFFQIRGNEDVKWVLHDKQNNVYDSSYYREYLRFCSECCPDLQVTAREEFELFIEVK